MPGLTIFGMHGSAFRFRKPDTLQPFRWPGLFFALAVAAIIMFLFGIVLDNTLRIFGIGMSAWFDALWDAFLGMFCGAIFAPLFWRIGLVTFPQYLLGAFALVVPITGVSLLILSRFHNIGVEVPGIDSASLPSQFIAITAYVRIIRAMLFVPVFLATFYWAYHVCLGMAPRTKADG